jgi:hypothetical protein
MYAYQRWGTDQFTSDYQPLEVTNFLLVPTLRWIATQWQGSLLATVEILT